MLAAHGHQQQPAPPPGSGSVAGPTGPNLNYAHSSTSSRRSSLRAPILSPVREVPSPAPNNGQPNGSGQDTADQHQRRHSLSQHDYSYSANTHASRDHLLMHRPPNAHANANANANGNPSAGGSSGTYMGQNGRIDRPSSIASTMSQLSHGSSGHFSAMTTGTNHRPPSIGVPMGHEQQQQAYYMPPEAKPLRPAPSHSSLRNVLFRTHPTSTVFHNAQDSPLHLPLTHRLAVHPVLALGVVSDPSLTPYGTLVNLLATCASHLAALTANGQAGTLAGHAELVTLVHQLTCLLAISLTYMPVSSTAMDPHGDQQHDQTASMLPDPDAFVAFAKTASIASICDKLALANATATEVAATDPRAARAMLVQAVDVASGVVGNLVRRVMPPDTLSRNLGVSVTKVLTRVVDALDPEWVASNTLARGKPNAPNVSRDLAKALVIARAALTSNSPTSPSASSTSSKLPLAPSIDRLWTATHWPESIPIADLVQALPAFLADDLGDAKDPAVAIVKWLVSSSSSSSSPIWRLSDLHLPSDPISPWTLSRTLAGLDVDEYVTWKLAGWMYLAVALEQRVYAATKPSAAKPGMGPGVACPGVLATLGGAHLARLAADMQVAMNLVRKRFHYSQQVHARLRAVYARVYQVSRVSPGAVPQVLGFDARFEDLLSLLFDTVGLVEALANGDEMPFVTDEVTVAFTATVRKLQTRLAGCVDELGISLPFWTADESADLKMRDSQAEYALRHARDTYVNSVAGLVSDRVLISPATVTDIELISDFHDDDENGHDSDEYAKKPKPSASVGAPIGLVASGKWCGQAVHLYALDQDEDEQTHAAHAHDDNDEDAETLAVQRAALAAALPPVPGLVHVLGLIPPGLALPNKPGLTSATSPSQSWYIMTSAGQAITSSVSATNTGRRSASRATSPECAFLGSHTALVPLTARALPLPEAIAAARTLAAALLVLYTHQVPNVQVCARQVLVDGDALGVMLAGVWTRTNGPDVAGKYCAPEWAQGGAAAGQRIDEADMWPATVYAFGVLVWELVVAARGGAGVFERGVPKVFVPDRGAGGASAGAGEAAGEWRLDMSVVEGAVVDAFPELIDTDAIDTLVLLIDACTSPHPSARPTFTDIVKHLDAIVSAMAQVQDVLPYAAPSGALRPLAEAESLSVWADAEEPQVGGTSGRHERGGPGTSVRGRAPPTGAATVGTLRGHPGGLAMAAVMASPMRYPVASVGYTGQMPAQEHGHGHDEHEECDEDDQGDDDDDDDGLHTEARYTDATQDGGGGAGEHFVTPAETPNTKPPGQAGASASVLKRTSSLTWSAAQRQQEMLARANSQGTVSAGHHPTAVRMGPVAGSMRMGSGVGGAGGGTMDVRRASMYAQGTPIGTVRGGGTTKQRPLSAIVSSMVPSSAGSSRMMSVRGGDSGIVLNQQPSQQPVVGTLASNSSGEEGTSARGGGKRSPPKILRKLKDKFSMHPSQHQHGLGAPVNKASISAPMTIYPTNAPHAQHLQQATAASTATADWIESQLELARGMIRAGELVSAVNVLRPLASNEHNVAAAHLLLGDCYVRGTLATTAIGTSGGTTSRALKGAVGADAALTTAATAPSASGSSAFESLINTHGLSRNIALARGHYASGLRLAQADASSSVMLPLAAAAHAGLGDCMLFTDKHAAEAHYLDALKCPVIAPADAVRARAGLAECLFATLQFREAREHAKLAALMAADVFDTAHKHQVPVWLSSCGKRAAARAALCELQLSGANDQVRNWLHAARAPLKAYAEAMEAWYRAQGMVEEAGRFKGLVGLYHEL
ncbi:hypothetical protein BCR44DRAFT_48714 [Catenaria anguillulae PL171]|uniref:Protein kinase domain-containing protein n=1 Tax=Catenaria anguillulae PL171 TaxID=765915 RepID=A0A1Y2HMK6_9FUNG|nr:hypothetical protein BCR44DRAFT_48714 [Catenaria anguillulae PL171]